MLDRKLANGTHPTQSDELSLRAGQLGSARMRVRLACTLRVAVELANGHREPLITTQLRRREIHENHQLLLALSDRLHNDEPLGVQGLAMTALLVDDHSGPLYQSGPSGSLPATVMEALAALDHGPQTPITIDARWSL